MLTMDQATRHAIEHECTKLLRQYCLFVDEYRHADVAALFAEDGLWETWKGPLTGRAAMQAYLDQKDRTPVTIHMVQNVIVDVVNDLEATGTSVFVYFGTDRKDAGATVPKVVGRYFDRFVKTSEGWRIAHRRTDMTFRAQQ
jgi:hypothetical protein